MQCHRPWSISAWDDLLPLVLVETFPGIFVPLLPRQWNALAKEKSRTVGQYNDLANDAISVDTLSKPSPNLFNHDCSTLAWPRSTDRRWIKDHRKLVWRSAIVLSSVRPVGEGKGREGAASLKANRNCLPAMKLGYSFLPSEQQKQH